MPIHPGFTARWFFAGDEKNVRLLSPLEDTGKNGRDENYEIQGWGDKLFAYRSAWAISCCMASITATGSTALEIGRPTTT